MEKKDPIILGYWNIRGLAEPIRLLLEYLGVNYKDELYDQGPAPEYSRECWLKKKLELGLDFPNLPYLIDSPIKITESVAIMRYICNKFEPKLLGTKLEEIAYVDMLCCVLYDFNGAKSEIMYTTDVASIPKRKFEILAEQIKRFAKMLETKKYLAGDKLTYVDFMCVEYLDGINDLIEPILKTYPSLERYYKDMMSLPNVQKYKTSEKFTKNPKPYNNKIARLGAAVLKK